MRDRDVRAALHRELRARHEGEPDTLILDELGLCEGESRVDVAVINGSLNGFEIKSERDTLDRLPAQAATYNRTLDFVTVVCAPTHAPQIAELVPKWWGIWVAVDSYAWMTLRPERDAAINPALDPLAIASLLWRAEALAELERVGAANGMRSKPRATLWSRLACCLPLDDLRLRVRCHLKARAGWRAEMSPPSDGDASQRSATS